MKNFKIALQKWSLEAYVKIVDFFHRIENFFCFICALPSFLFSYFVFIKMVIFVSQNYLGFDSSLNSNLFNFFIAGIIGVVPALPAIGVMYLVVMLVFRVDEKMKDKHEKIENKIAELTESQKIMTEASLLSEGLGQAPMVKKMKHKI